MSPVILLPTTPSNVTCQKHGRVAFIINFKKIDIAEINWKARRTTEKKIVKESQP